MDQHHTSSTTLTRPGRQMPPAHSDRGGTHADALAAEIAAQVARLPIDDRLPGEPKDPDTSPLFRLYAAFASPTKAETMRLRFHGGISWADARTDLTSLLLRLLAADPGARDRVGTELRAAAGPARSVPVR